MSSPQTGDSNPQLKMFSSMVLESQSFNLRFLMEEFGKDNMLRSLKI